MKELLKFIVEHLVENKDAIEIREDITDSEITLHLHVAEDDMGRVIGRKGRIASSIRTILRSCQMKEGKNVFVEIED